MTDTHDLSYYLKCMVGGVLACGLTHAAIVPLDVVKCKRQVNTKFSSNLLNGLSILKSRGELTLAFVPTLIGYSFQGFGKYGFYEIFKDVYKNIVGEQNAKKYKAVGWSIASGSAEVIADVLLCPWQAVKLKIQLPQPDKQYPRSMIQTINIIRAEQGIAGFYKGLLPLWGRQIPYTIVKFVAFQKITQLFYQHIFTQKKQTYTKATQLGITFVSGYLAGIFCAIVSHPADTMVSKIYSRNKEPGTTMEKMSQIYKEIGFRGLWNGLLTRIVMIGTLTGFQWWIYDSFKTAVGLQIGGGSADNVKLETPMK